MRTIFLFHLALVGCGDSEPDEVPAFATNVGVATVLERVDAGDRQLVRIEEDPFDFWASLPATPAVEVGDRLWLGQGPEVDDAIVIDQVAVATEAQIAGFERLDPPEGGLSIEQVFADRQALHGQRVRVRGRIVKASYDIFDTNWYHLRDGTGGEGTNDLTVTSDERFEAGQIVTFEGPLTADKDLGFGYRYDAIVEGADTL